MILKTACLAVLCVCFAACFRDNSAIFTQNFNTTVLVTDMDNKPLAAQKVLLFISSAGNGLRAKDSAITDNLGKVRFAYDLTTSDSHTDNAVLKSEDNVVWKSVDAQGHNTVSNGEKPVTQELRLRKDSLSPIRIRLQKTTTTPWTVDLSAYATNNPTEKNKQTRSFLAFQRDALQLFDTTFIVPVYANTSISVEAGTFRLSANGSGGYSIVRGESQLLEIKPVDYKSTVLNIQVK